VLEVVTGQQLIVVWCSWCRWPYMGVFESDVVIGPRAGRCRT
jgi:hypothetical protein